MTDWNRIVTDHGPIIFRLACRILGCGPDAEDVVQEAFLEGYRVGLAQAVENWGGLLGRAVTHRAIDRLRRRRPTEPLSGSEPALGQAGPAEAAIAGELAEQLRDAIAHLPRQQAAVFCLRYFDELSYDEIAERLELETGAVGVTLHKARNKLKSMLPVSVHED